MGVKIGGVVSPVTPENLQVKDPVEEAIQIHKAAYLEAMRRVKRPGMDEMMAWLETTDFYRAPASTKYHGNFDGGLCAHHNAVIRNALKLASVIFGDEVEEQDIQSIILTAGTHDYCKIGYYKKEKKWRKDDDGNGKWESYYGWNIDDQRPAGHGEKSVFIVKDFIKIGLDEEAAINFHMNGSDDRNYAYGGSRAIIDAKNKYPLLILISAADEVAAFIDGV